MEYYIDSIRAAASACEPRELKPVLDFLLGQAQEDYRAGALGVTEYGDIVNEYADTLTTANTVNYN
jgi:hypothetical protein